MLSTIKRSFFPAAWLGWQIESNWTDPILFFGYSVLKPLAGVLILVFMYTAVSGTGTNSPMYAYIYVGNAFYIYVGALLAGASYAVLDDRERYRVLKYLYIAPIHMPTYLFGRAVARFITGSIAVVITLATGILFFNVPIHPAQVDWLLFFPALAIGVVSLVPDGHFHRHVDVDHPKRVVANRRSGGSSALSVQRRDISYLYPPAIPAAHRLPSASHLLAGTHSPRTVGTKRGRVPNLCRVVECQFVRGAHPDHNSDCDRDLWGVSAL